MKIEERIQDHLKAYRAKNGKSQKEMAAYLGVSYVTYQEMERGIVKSVKNFNKIKDKTGFNSDTQETVYEKEGDVGNELNRLIELSIKHEATLDVLRLSVEGILADLKGKSLALVSGELQQAIRMRADKLYDEFLKKK